MENTILSYVIKLNINMQNLFSSASLDGSSGKELPRYVQQAYG